MDERSLMKCVNDFDMLIEFNEVEKPKLSLIGEVFGKKDCFKLNSLLESQKLISLPNYNQNKYPIIDLMFDLALLGKLYYKGNNEKGKLSLSKTSRLDHYVKLNNFEKYAFLLQTYWTEYEFSKKFERMLSVYQFYNFLVEISNSKPGKEIIKIKKNHTGIIYSRGALFQHHLRFFGMGEPDLITREKYEYDDDSIRAFFPTSLGIEVAGFLCTEALEFWNKEDIYALIMWKNNINKKIDMSERLEIIEPRKRKTSKELFEIFKKIFPEGKVVNTIKDLDS